MNYWEEKIEFWRNKTYGNKVYTAQKQEIADDIYKLAKTRSCKSVLDAGGYDGALGKLLPEDIEYKCVDIKTGFDLTKNWPDQGINQQYDIVVFSLVLLTISPDYIYFVMNEAYRCARKIIYVYDENPGQLMPGHQVSDEYGGKWIVTLAGIIGDKKYSDIRNYASMTSRNWRKYYLIK